ncbi:Glutathione S-transferase [Eumeta japonica]|uniref:glutathione transferase n=1 Tax=Eumeta variegata TaxID=151549 RepID=A0A4C1VR47_EUMVA|nr:Glutathione S-transferase [Eumeta japonica]
MAKKLHYFDLNGLAESIRYLLHYGEHKFEDVRYNHLSWPLKEVKDDLPFGQLPLFEEGNKKLNQSLAIARYIAYQVKLLPSDPWEQAVLDAIVFNIYDFWGKVVAYIREQDQVKRANLKKEILEETVDYFFSRFEKTLEQNNGYFGGKLSWADFILLGIIESANLFLGEQIERKYPHVQNLFEKIRNLQGVKEYIAGRKDYKLA